MVSLSQTHYIDLYLGDPITGLALPMEISWGVSGKYLRQNLDANSATGQGLDAGLLLRMTHSEWDRLEPLSWIGIGAMLRDISHTRLQWNTASEHQDTVEMASSSAQQPRIPSGHSKAA
jgi:hypothetical protein